MNIKLTRTSPRGHQLTSMNPPLLPACPVQGGGGFKGGVFSWKSVDGGRRRPKEILRERLFAMRDRWERPCTSSLSDATPGSGASFRSYHPCYSRLRSERRVVAVRTFPSIPRSCRILFFKIFYRDYFTKSAIQYRNFAQHPFHVTHGKSRPRTPTEMRLRRDKGYLK